MMRKGVMIYGLDWVIYQLALSKGWTAQRLPFLRSEIGANHKTEAEFGIDLAFLREESKELVIFVLKDEPLKNTTWSSERIKDDLEKAMYPDMSAPEFESVVRVTVVLGYNKDDDKTGVGLFERFSASQPPKIVGGRDLCFERWNLSRISDEVHENLLSPALLPEGVSELLRYVATHFKQCHAGSDSWIKVMLPNWDNLISQVLESEESDGRKISILSMVAIIIGKSRGHANGSDMGYIELIERLLLQMWAYAANSRSKAIRSEVSQVWVLIYLSELERFYQKHGPLLKNAHAVSVASRANGLDSVNAGYNAYWHLARIGLFAYGLENITDQSEEVQEYLQRKHLELADIVERMVYNEPGSLRPLIDANITEVFLIWRLLVRCGRIKVLFDFLDRLVDRLFVRRINKVGLPFLDGRNNYKIVAEAAATREMHDVGDQSSFFCMALMEFCLPFEEAGVELIEKIYRHLVLSQDHEGEKYPDAEPLDLICWAPKEGWEISALRGEMGSSVGISVGALHEPGSEIDGKSIVSNLRLYKEEYLKKYPIPKSTGVPAGAMVLACIVHRHAIPPYLWRRFVYEQKFYEKDA